MFLLVLSACSEAPVESPQVPEEAPDEEILEFASYTDIETLFERLNYTQAAWDDGIREVPRVFMTNIPSRWRNSTTQEITVATKKRLFFRLLGPGALRANELIEADRSRLLAVAENREAFSDEDAEWLAALAKRYGVPADLPMAEETLGELITRVDIVPASLVLAQAAEESGWGTSRFADLGNALFGQWTWSEGVEPLRRREGKGEYNIAQFETPLDSVRAYMRNLNTHGAYLGLRARRAEMRRDGQRPNGWELARTLTSYSERGEEYVQTLHTIMRVNDLSAADEAYLSDMPPIHLVPIGEGAE